MSATFTQNVKTLQRYAGVLADGDFGSVSAAALVAKLGLSVPARPAPTSGIVVGLDAGHGQSNRKAGLYDPGCVFSSYQEATIAMEWVDVLAAVFKAQGIAHVILRPTPATSAPVGQRARKAKDAGCTHLLSVHVNDSDSPQATGTETLYLDDAPFAHRINKALASGLELTDRGIKHRTDLAVLRFDGESALIEVGFIKNAHDRSRFMDRGRMERTARLIAAAVRESDK